MRGLAELPFRGRTSWSVPLALLAVTIVAFDVTDWDVRIQDHFWTPGVGWSVSLRKYSGAGLVYYTLPKLLLGLWGLCLGGWCVWKVAARRVVPWRGLYILCVMLAVPCVVANLKSYNSMPYPSKLTRYGGREERKTVVEAFRHPRQPNGKRYHGWPAGHASGGFSLMGLAFAPRRRRWRWLGFGLATGLGLAMGVCHTMDGAHFLSHTFVSLFIAWLLAACLYGLLPRLRLFLSRPHWRRHHHESAHHRG